MEHHAHAASLEQVDYLMREMSELFDCEDMDDQRVHRPPSPGGSSPAGANHGLHQQQPQQMTAPAAPQRQMWEELHQPLRADGFELQPIPDLMAWDAAEGEHDFAASLAAEFGLDDLASPDNLIGAANVADFHFYRVEQAVSAPVAPHNSAASAAPQNSSGSGAVSSGAADAPEQQQQQQQHFQEQLLRAAHDIVRWDDLRHFTDWLPGPQPQPFLLQHPQPQQPHEQQSQHIRPHTIGHFGTWVQEDVQGTLVPTPLQSYGSTGRQVSVPTGQQQWPQQQQQYCFTVGPHHQHSAAAATSLAASPTAHLAAPATAVAAAAAAEAPVTPAAHLRSCTRGGPGSVPAAVTSPQAQAQTPSAAASGSASASPRPGPAPTPGPGARAFRSRSCSPLESALAVQNPFQGRTNSAPLRTGGRSSSTSSGRGAGAGSTSRRYESMEQLVIDVLAEHLALQPLPQVQTNARGLARVASAITAAGSGRAAAARPAAVAHTAASRVAPVSMPTHPRSSSNGGAGATAAAVRQRAAAGDAAPGTSAQAPAAAAAAAPLPLPLARSDAVAGALAVAVRRAQEEAAAAAAAAAGAGCTSSVVGSAPSASV